VGFWGVGGGDGASCDMRRGMRENALVDDLELELGTCGATHLRYIKTHTSGYKALSYSYAMRFRIYFSCAFEKFIIFAFL